MEQPIYKHLFTYNKEDFESLLENEKIKLYLIKTNPDRHEIILGDEYPDALCPKCSCPSIASVINSSNIFIDECVGCKLHFAIRI